MHIPYAIMERCESFKFLYSSFVSSSIFNLIDLFLTFDNYTAKLFLNAIESDYLDGFRQIWFTFDTIWSFVFCETFIKLHLFTLKGLHDLCSFISLSWVKKKSVLNHLWFRIRKHSHKYTIIWINYLCYDEEICKFKKYKLFELINEHT